MLEFYKTFEDGTRRIAEPEPGCWINAVAPTEEERNFLIEQIGILPEFVKSSLDEEESSHIDYDDDFRQVLIIFDYPSAENEDDEWVQTRMEMNLAREWYLVGTPYCGNLEYVQARISG